MWWVLCAGMTGLGGVRWCGWCALVWECPPPPNPCIRFFVWQARRSVPEAELLTRNDFVSRLLVSRKVCARAPSGRIRRHHDVLCASCVCLIAVCVGMQADGTTFSDDEVLEFVRNFMIAGRDTTAVTLMWCEQPPSLARLFF